MSGATLRQIATAYEAAIRTNAERDGRDVETEARAAIAGAAKCLRYPTELVASLVREQLNALDVKQ